jgi:serine/threonine protein kinase
VDQNSVYTQRGINAVIGPQSPDLKDLISQLLCYDPDQRITAREALLHPFFADVRNGSIALGGGLMESIY